MNKLLEHFLNFKPVFIESFQFTRQLNLFKYFFVLFLQITASIIHIGIEFGLQTLLLLLATELIKFQMKCQKHLQ